MASAIEQLSRKRSRHRRVVGLGGMAGGDLSLDLVVAQEPELAIDGCDRAGAASGQTPVGDKETDMRAVVE
jgi:hypothetical protein